MNGVFEFWAGAATEARHFNVGDEIQFKTAGDSFFFKKFFHTTVGDFAHLEGGQASPKCSLSVIASALPYLMVSRLSLAMGLFVMPLSWTSSLSLAYSSVISLSSFSLSLILALSFFLSLSVSLCLSVSLSLSLSL